MNLPVDTPRTVWPTVSPAVAPEPASTEDEVMPANGAVVAALREFGLDAGNHAFTVESQVPFLRPPAVHEQYGVQRRSSESSNDRGSVSSWYSEAMEELEGIEEEAQEDGLPEIPMEVKKDARAVLRAIATRGFRTHPSVYPTETGEIALYFKSALVASSVLIEIGRDGRASFFASSGIADRCALSGSAEEVLDSLLWKRLSGLEYPT